MSGDERRSPRAAIRNWLNDTETKSVPAQVDLQPHQLEPIRQPRHHSRRRVPPAKTVAIPRDHREHGCHQEHERRRKHRKDSKSELAQAVRYNPDKAQLYRQSEQHPGLRPGVPSLAERLGLHAPFRTFKDQDDDSDAILRHKSRSWKRRRTKSSSSSYLEPAAVSEHAPEDQSCTGISGRRGVDRKHAEKCPGFSSGVSNSSARTLPSLEKPKKSYERQPRHKTRDDRYELKESKPEKKKTKASKRDGTEKKHKKQGRKEKSGAALMHDFSAQNVSSDRLTLQPAKSLGLFGKGRASSPVRRRGLPDLTFSEIAFLNSRRTKPEDLARSKEKNRWRKSKAADTEAEISRYFTSAKAPEQATAGQQDHETQRELYGRSPSHNSLPPFVDIPDTPFLGFGSCGANSVSPVKRSGSPAQRDLERKHVRSPTRSTSYLTWSRSGTRYQISPRRDEHKVRPLESSGLSNRKASSPVSHELRPSNPPKPSSLDPKTSAGKRDIITFPTPQTKVHSRSRHSREPSPQQDNPNEHVSQTKEYQQAEKAMADAKGTSPSGVASREGLGAIARENNVPRPHTSYPSDLTPSNLKAAPVSKGHEQSPQVAPTPQLPELGDQDNVSPLDATLEALLQSCRSSILTPRILTAVEQADSSARIPVHDSVRQLHVDPAPEERSPLSFARNNLAKEQSRFQRPAHISSRQNLGSQRRPNSMNALDLPCSPKQSRGYSRSAWNGYETVYEQQQKYRDPHLLDERRYETNANVLGKNGFGSVGEDQEKLADVFQEPSHSPIQMDHEFDDIRIGLRESPFDLPSADAYPGEEIYNNDGPFYDAEEMLFAQYDNIYPDQSFDQGNRTQSQGHRFCEEPQQESELMDELPQYQRQTSTRNMTNTYSPWRPDTSRPIGNSGHGWAGNTPGTLQRVQDTAPPPGFWTPHKLY